MANNRILLVSIEDAYGCKRPLSVSGVSVNVKRVRVGGFIRFSNLVLLNHVTSAYCQILRPRWQTTDQHFARQIGTASFAAYW